MSPLTSILATDRQPIPPKLLPNVLAGLTVGLVSLTYSVSFAALIFTGNLSPGFPQGVGSALITSAIVGAIVALCSSFPFAIAGPDSTATAAIALMTAAIAGEIQQSHGGAERLFPTVWMAIALSTCLTGVLLYAVGRMRLGRWARFIPYPVMGGFLAGTGLLITCSSFAVMAGVRLGWQELPQLCQAATTIHWLPGVLFAAVSIGVTKIYPQPLVLPAILLGTIVSFNLLWQAILASSRGYANGVFVPLNPHGWFLEAVASDKLWHSWTAASFAQIDWQVLLGQLGASIVLVVVVGTANTLLESVSGRLRDPTIPPTEFIILDFRLVSGLDASAVLSFIKMRQLGHKHEVRLVFTQLHANIFQKLQQGDCIQTQNDLIQVFDRLDGGLEWCEDRILETRSLRRPRTLPLALQLGDIFTDPNQVASFMSYLHKIQVEIDRPLFSQGESPETLYFIESGRVTESGRLQHGQTRRWQTLGAGTIVGENSFYLGTPHHTAAIAELPTTLYCLSRSHLQTMRQEHPQVVTAFEDFIIRLLVDRLMYAHTEIEELL